MAFLRVSSMPLLLRRITARVKQGGHHVPRADVWRRFVRGWKNFEVVYKPLADMREVYDNSGDNPVLLEKSK
jgi:predicted ABC-type ATPase